MSNYTDQEGFITVRNRRNQNRKNQNRRNQQIASPPNYWLKLPREIIITILQKIGVLHILLSAQLVCTQWREICTDPSMWATIRVYYDPYRSFFSDEYRTHVENMIRWAVDQSCGSLFDLDLDRLISEELLYYVIERCNRIRRLRVEPTCYFEDVLERVVTRLPLLEDFELVGDNQLSSEAIETLGRYCPKLSSLEIHVHSDGEAKTLARTMPQLRHICLSGESFVTDVGVEALLDGCPHLESLIIRGCYFFEMTGVFQMKNLPLTRTQWRDVLDDPSTWSTICVDRRIFTYYLPHNCEEFKYMIRRAVDKSCGGLVDLDLGEYMSVHILDYVIERCTRIRRLHGYIPDCSEEAVRAALARLPLLEDLSLYYEESLSAETMETLMRCCPGLTSLEIPIDDDDEAETLARSFPQLRHLKPFHANKLTDSGVEALLDGCPHLESLDLQECDRVALKDTLGIRCAQKMKYFQRPFQLYRPKYCCSCCGSIEYQIYEDDDFDQFSEEDVNEVDYTIYRREEYWIRREKSRGKKTQYSKTKKSRQR